MQDMIYPNKSIVEVAVDLKINLELLDLYAKGVITQMELNNLTGNDKKEQSFL